MSRFELGRTKQHSHIFRHDIIIRFCPFPLLQFSLYEWLHSVNVCLFAISGDEPTWSLARWSSFNDNDIFSCPVESYLIDYPPTVGFLICLSDREEEI